MRNQIFSRASAETAGVLSGDGWFSFKYNTVIGKDRALSVSLEDGSRSVTVINRGKYLEILQDGTAQTRFAYDANTNIKIERVSGAVKIWQNGLLRFTTIAGYSSGPAIFRIDSPRRSTVSIGINTCELSGASSSGAAPLVGPVVGLKNQLTLSTKLFSGN